MATTNGNNVFVTRPSDQVSMPRTIAHLAQRTKKANPALATQIDALAGTFQENTVIATKGDDDRLKIPGDIVRVYTLTMQEYKYYEKDKEPFRTETYTRSVTSSRCECCVSRYDACKKCRSEDRAQTKEKLDAVVSDVLRKQVQIALVHPICVEMQGDWDAVEALAELHSGPRVFELQAEIGIETAVMNEVARSIRGMTNVPGVFDAPAIYKPEPANYTVCDEPRAVTSMGFRQQDVHADDSSILGAFPHDGSILPRLKIASRMKVFTWSTTQAVGVLLTTIPVSPMVCILQAAAGGFFVFDNTMLSAVGSMYRYWRGGLIYTFEIVATQFHQGQLFVAFNPGPGSTPTMTTVRNCLSATIDVGTNNRLSFKVPYVAGTDYKHVANAPTSSLATNPDEYTGDIHVYVQNPLTVNGTIATTVEVNVYISAADNFSFHVPRNPVVQLFVEGQWEGDQEDTPAESLGPPPKVMTKGRSGSVLKSTVNDPKAKRPQQGLRNTARGEIAIDCNVMTASTANILADEYLVEFNGNWSTTIARNISLQDIPLPKTLFDDANLAPLGIWQFHYLYRLGFEASLRINPTQFHQGILMLVWIPWLPGVSQSLTNDSLSSYTQYPHAFLNVATETSVSLDIPYSYYQRVQESNPGVLENVYGHLRVFIWNVLQAGTNASTVLSYSIWLKPIDPWFAVRRVRVTGAALQADDESASSYVSSMKAIDEPRAVEISDTAKEVIVDQTPFRPAGPDKDAYIKSDHMNFYHLLKRNEYTGSFDINQNEVLSTHVTRYAHGPLRGGRTQKFVRCMFAYNSGGWRVTFQTPASHVTNIAMFAVVRYNDALGRVEWLNTTHTEQNLASLSYDQVVSWNLREYQAKTVEIPQYLPWPLIVNPRTVGNVGGEIYNLATLDIYASNDAPTVVAPSVGLTQALVFFVFEAAAEDFRLYFPTAPPVTRIAQGLFDAVTGVWTISRALQERMDNPLFLQGTIWDPVPDVVPAPSLLLSGDVEQNPGPVFSKLRATYEEVQHIRVESVIRDSPTVNLERYLEAVYEGDSDDSVDSDEEVGPRLKSYYSSDEDSTTPPRRRSPVLQKEEEYLDAYATDNAAPVWTFFSKVFSGSWNTLIASITPFLILKDKTVELVRGFISSKPLKRAVNAIDLANKWELRLTQIFDFVRNMLTLGTIIGNVVAWCHGSRAAKALALSNIGLISWAYGNDLICYVLKQLQGVRNRFCYQSDVKEVLDEGIAFGIPMIISSTLVSLVLGAFALRGWSFKNSQDLERNVMNNLVGPEIRNIGKNVNTALCETFKYLICGATPQDNWWEKSRAHYGEMIGAWHRLDGELAFSAARIHEMTDEVPHVVSLVKFHGFAVALKERLPLMARAPVEAGKWADAVIEAFKNYRMLRAFTVQRPEPIGIYLYGPPGSGKSLISTTILPETVLMQAKFAKDIDEASLLMYPIPNDPDQKFFDGYAGQPFSYYDDLGAGREGKDFLQMVNLISCAACPLNQARIDDKGMMYTSQFLCASTNISSVMTVVALNDPSAFVRRFPFSFKVTARPNFVTTDPKLDHKKMVAHLKSGGGDGKTVLDLWKCCDEIWKFEILDCYSGATHGEILAQEWIPAVIQDFHDKVLGTQEFKAARRSYAVYEGDGDDYDDPMYVHNRPWYVRWTLRYTPLRMTRGWLFQEFDTTLGPQKLFARDRAGYHQADDVGIDTVLGCRDVFVSRYKLAKNKREKEGAFLYLERNMMEAGYSSYKDMMSLVGFSPGDQPPDVDMAKVDVKDDRYFAKFVIKAAMLSQNGGRIAPAIARYGCYVGFYTGIIQAFVCIGAGITMAYIVGKILVYLYRSLMGLLFSYEGDYSRDVPGKPSGKVIPKPVKIAAAFQGDDDIVSQNQKEVSNLIRRNMRGLRTVDDAGNVLSEMSALCLDNSYILFPQHFYKSAFEKDATWQLALVGRNGFIGYVPVVIDGNNSIQVVDGEPTDVRLARLDAIIPCAKDIWKHIVTRAESEFLLNNVTSAAVVLGHTNHYAKQGERIYDDVTVHIRNNVETDVNFDIPLVWWQAKEGMTSRGYCGLPYFSLTAKGSAIIGMHSAGTNCKPILPYVACTLLKRELLEGHRGVLSSHCGADRVHVEYEAPAGFISQKTVHNWDAVMMEPIGAVVMQGITINKFQPRNTDRVHSFIRDVELWPDGMLPSAKQIVDGKDPLVINAQKYEITAKSVFGSRITRWATECIMRKTTLLRGAARRLTDFEVLNGIEGSTVFGQLMRNTSAGYWSEISGGKRDLLDVEEIPGKPNVFSFSEIAKTRKHPWTGKTFLETLEERDRLAQVGVRAFSVWGSTLKDELRSVAKVEAGKTRVFECPSLDYTLLIRKYFGAFLNSYKSFPGFELWHGIGLEKDACWGAYWSGLCIEGSKTRGFDLDYTNYDGTVTGQAFEAFRVITDDFYENCGKDDRAARHTLLHELQLSLHLIGSECYHSYQGNKSGNPMTDVFNSVCNTWYVHCAFYVAHRLHFGSLPEMGKLDRVVRMLTYGDDVIITATRDTLEWFHRAIVCEILHRVGLQPTAADKTIDNLKKTDKVANLTFLKSRFVATGNLVLAPMPLQVIYRELNWVKKDVKRNITVKEQMLHESLRFMAHHGHAQHRQLLHEIEVNILKDPDLKYYGVEIFPSHSLLMTEIRSKQEAFVLPILRK